MGSEMCIRDSFLTFLIQRITLAIITLHTEPIFVFIYGRASVKELILGRWLKSLKIYNKPQHEIDILLQGSLKSASTLQSNVLAIFNARTVEGT